MIDTFLTDIYLYTKLTRYIYTFIIYYRFSPNLKLHFDLIWVQISIHFDLIWVQISRTHHQTVVVIGHDLDPLLFPKPAGSSHQKAIVAVVAVAGDDRTVRSQSLDEAKQLALRYR